MEYTKLVNGKTVVMSEEEVTAFLAQQEKDSTIDPNILADKNRLVEYGSIGDQLDMIFHEGLDAWKLHIQSIKDKYPKV